ncbi:Wilms tumor protein-like [Gracilariopsis chorda]|uniref:Wilms tumor protein-like n=1 Tax=Gracilariopsis chorda TaxID=448386 RepID=A0A2V3IFB6_9FLOR|nr:Wilms tumor protein-like [Gracilariopsis chorda]|eukprot:PXF40789.1 Wilms tumor protein-like [Gracilariopsis chorda]
MDPTFAPEAADSFFDLESTFRSYSDFIYSREEYSIPELMMNTGDQGMPTDVLGSMVYGSAAADVAGVGHAAPHGVPQDRAVSPQYATYPTFERRLIDENDVGERVSANQATACTNPPQLTRQEDMVGGTEGGINGAQNLGHAGSCMHFAPASSAAEAVGTVEGSGGVGLTGRRDESEIDGRCEEEDRWEGVPMITDQDGRRVPKHRCSVCQRVFKRAHNLKIHNRKHTGEMPFGCPFPECEKEFRWKSSIASHIDWHKRKNPLGVADFNLKRLIRKGKEKQRMKMERRSRDAMLEQHRRQVEYEERMRTEAAASALVSASTMAVAGAAGTAAAGGALAGTALGAAALGGTGVVGTGMAGASLAGTTFGRAPVAEACVGGGGGGGNVYNYGELDGYRQAVYGGEAGRVASMARVGVAAGANWMGRAKYVEAESELVGTGGAYGGGGGGGGEGAATWEYMHGVSGAAAAGRNEVTNMAWRTDHEGSTANGAFAAAHAAEGAQAHARCI